METLRQVGVGWLELVAPRRCLGCQLGLHPHDVDFCEGCAPLIEFAPAAFQPPAWAGAVYCYGGPIAAAIQSLKYGRRSEHAAALGKRLASVAVAHAGSVDEVIPMPLHPRKLRARGFNQAALIATPVARALGVGLNVRQLRRVRDTDEQAGLSRKQRTRNLDGAFSATRRGVSTRVLLIDDVRTTGATMAAAAAALLDAGHAMVITLALARTEL